MSYKSRKDYVLDCIMAATGTAVDENYYAQNFDDIIGVETPEQSVCSAFVQFVKKVEFENISKYGSRTNFNAYLLEKRESDSLLDIENNLIDLIYERVDFNKQNNNSELPEPTALFEKLAEARKKLDLSNRLRNLSEQDEYSQDAVTWSDKFCNSLLESIEDTSESYENNRDDKLYYGEDVKDFYLKRIEERENGESYHFGNIMLDSLVTEGPTPGHGGIIAGSTGMGKSALCLNIINDMINADIPCIYFPIEMGMENTIDRLVSLRTHIPFRQIVNIGKQDRDIDEPIKELVLHEANGLSTHPNFAIVNRPNISINDISNSVKKFQARLSGRKYCVVFIDLLLMVKEFYDDGSNMAQMIERAINKLDILAKRLNFHWVGVVQLNRSIESDKILSEQSIDKLKPTRSSIKNSSALLERARWAVTIFRKRYFADLYLSEEQAAGIEDIAEIQLMKANDESISRRYMTFNGPTFEMKYAENYGKSANGF